MTTAVGVDTTNVWLKLAHFLAPFLRRVVVGGLSLVSWRDATIRQQVTAHYLADDQAAGAVHSQMLAYYQRVWSGWRARFVDRQDASHVQVFSRSSPSSAFRYHFHFFPVLSIFLLSSPPPFFFLLPRFS